VARERKVTAMKISRRGMLQRAIVAALSAISGITRADVYPSRPVRVIVPFPASNASDIIARLLAQSLTERFHQPFFIENRPGAGGTVGAEVVAKAPPDGHTLLMEVVTAEAINATLYANLDFNFIRDIAPVASIGEGPYVMLVNPAVPAKTVPEFIAYAKAHPNMINMASAGNATATHIFGALFMMMADVKLVHVPYRGTFMPDLLAGQVQVVFGPLSQSIEYIKAGKLRALAVTTAKRDAALQDIPSLSEFLPGYEASGLYGIGAPRATSSEIIEMLNHEINAALADPKVRARLARIGINPIPMTSDEFEKFIAAETEKWGKVVRAANIAPD
jgi:tripartite-type tricarboxylate transporter receptor subunit TctC